MKLDGDYQFEAPVAEVWSALFDPVVLAAVMPGCEKLDLIDGQFVGDLNIKVGPVQGKFSGKVELKDVDEPKSYTMVIDGRGAPGFVKATAVVKLEADGEHTRMRYDADAQIGGKIASVGQRLIEASARAISKQSLEGLHENIKIRFAAANQAKARAQAKAEAAARAEAEAEAEVAAEAEAEAKAEAEVAAEAKAKAEVEAKVEVAAKVDTEAKTTAEAAVTSEVAEAKSEVAEARSGAEAESEEASAASEPKPKPKPKAKPKAAPREETPSEPPPPPVLKTVDQKALAASVAREVTKSLLPPPVMFGIAIAVVVLVLWLAFRTGG